MGLVILLSILLVVTLVTAIAFYLSQPAGISIATETEDQRALISVHGKVTIGVRDEELKNAILDLLDQGIKHFVIDVGNVTKIDSSGIVELVVLQMTVSKRGGTLEIRGLPLIFPEPPDFPNFPDGFAV